MRTAAEPSPAVHSIPVRERLLAWKEVLETANPPVARPLDTVGKWLVITRAAHSKRARTTSVAIPCRRQAGSTR